MRIGLMGLSDKRHVVYSMIRVLGNLGRTIYVTSNQQYLMLSVDHLEEFEIGDAHVLVYSGDIEEIEEAYELDSYEYIIYDVLLQVPAQLDSGIIFDSHEHYVFGLEDNDLEGIQLFTACNVKKDEMLAKEKIIKIPPASLVEPILQEMFNKQTLLPVKNAAFIAGMTKVLSYVTGLGAGQISSKLKKGEQKV